MICFDKHFQKDFQITEKGYQTIDSGDDDDNDSKYRYVLGRVLKSNPATPKSVCFFMLNPSRANHKKGDRTMERVIKIVEKWDEGYSHLTVVNLFPLRTPCRRELREHLDRVVSKNDKYLQPKNDKYIQQAIQKADQIIVAWGNDGTLLDRNEEVRTFITDADCLNKTYCLHKVRQSPKTRDKQPRHPRPLPVNAERTLWQD